MKAPYHRQASPPPASAIVASCSQDQSPEPFPPTEASFARTSARRRARSRRRNHGREGVLHEHDRRDEGSCSRCSTSRAPHRQARRATQCGFDILTAIAAAADAGAPTVKGTPAQRQHVRERRPALHERDGLRRPDRLLVARSAQRALRGADGSGSNAGQSHLLGPVRRVRRGADAPATGRSAARRLFYGMPAQPSPTLGNEPSAGDLSSSRRCPSGLTFSPRDPGGRVRR